MIHTNKVSVSKFIESANADKNQLRIWSNIWKMTISHFQILSQNISFCLQEVYQMASASINKFQHMLLIKQIW